MIRIHSAWAFPLSQPPMPRIYLSRGYPVTNSFLRYATFVPSKKATAGKSKKTSSKSKVQFPWWPNAPANIGDAVHLHVLQEKAKAENRHVPDLKPAQWTQKDQDEIKARLDTEFHRLADMWPIDEISIEQFPDALRDMAKRAFGPESTKAMTPERLLKAEESRVAALNILDDKYRRQYKLPDSITRPAAYPHHYENLAIAVDRVADYVRRHGFSPPVQASRWARFKKWLLRK